MYACIYYYLIAILAEVLFQKEIVWQWLYDQWCMHNTIILDISNTVNPGVLRLPESFVVLFIIVVSVVDILVGVKGDMLSWTPITQVKNYTLCTEN